MARAEAKAKLRPESAKDAAGVDEARAILSMLERWMSGRTWAAGDDFSMADCAAMSPFFYADAVHPYRAAYFEWLVLRPSVQQLIREVQP